ncbi:2-hydroxyacid dehydrogenase [Salinarimonas rosea]|uniref:2-hydroxyacid dehydrogenase n=1 Tax=Salinarimonas rosea TaxID=552063 RepID=UPI0003F61E2F|nr:NAD(P)-dependent oxidoreductase [Salinarimonas rosea]
MSRRPVFVLPDTSADTLALLEASGAMARLAAGGEVRVHVGRAPDAETFAQRIAEADGVMLAWDFPSAAFPAAPRLKRIAFCGSGASSYVDLALAAAHGVDVTTAPGYGDRAIAEHALGLALATLRAIPAADATVRAGGWEVAHQGRELSGAIVGLVGWGGIAKAFARLLAGFEATILVHTRSRAPGVREGAIDFVALDDLLARADIVSLHLAATPQTAGILDARRIAAMHRDAILVNTARGALVDEAALIEALAEERLAGAGLDVFAHEPLAADSPLRRLKNVVLTPHVAFRTSEARTRLYNRVVESLVSFTGYSQS